MPSISPNNLKLFQDQSFSRVMIRDFCAEKLGVAPEVVTDTLFAALPVSQQTDVNKEYISKSMNYTVNASGATILLVNTNEGLQLVYGNSQRREKVISHNGSCEDDESMEAASLREFREELGNPDEHGILFEVVNNTKNYQSLAIANNIGETAEKIAAKIVAEKANKAFIYFNMSLICCNEKPVSYNKLCEEIKQINERLKIVAPYYLPAVTLVFDDRAKKTSAPNLDTDLKARSEAINLINDFNKNCQSIITPWFKSLFNQEFNHEMDTKLIKRALMAIIDLTETNEIGLTAKNELNQLLQSDVNKINEQGYFKPSFKNLILHQGNLNSERFLKQFEPSLAQSLTLGFASPNRSSTSEISAPLEVQSNKL